MAPDHSSHDDDKSHGVSRALAALAVGGAAVGGAIILAPHLLPLLGAGTTAVAEESFFALHTYESGAGLAGFLNKGLAAVPLVGDRLAQGGLFNVAATALTGIGGVLLGNFIHKNEDGSQSFSWGRAIKYAALATSAMIALPTVLTGLGAGLIYLATVFAGAETASAVIGMVAGTVGTVGYAQTTVMAGLSGLAATIPHLITCGFSLLPAGLAFALARENRKASAAAAAPDVGSRVAAEVEIDRPTALGKPCTAKIKLKHADTGLPLTADELAVVHTEKLHLFIIDSSLRDYQHIHPQPTGEPGVFSFHFTPESANRYSVWAEATPLKENKTYQLKIDLPSAARRHIPPVVHANADAGRDGLNFRWSGDPLRQGAPGIVEVSITDDRGRAVTDLEPVMGAMAHLVGFPADGTSLIHTHPLAGGDASRLRFHIEPERAGAVQFYLQIRRRGEDIYVPFGQQVQPPALATEKLSLPSHAAMGHSL